MSKNKKTEEVSADIQSKADAFDKIVIMNHEVMRLARVMNEKHQAHQEAVKNYKEQDKELQKLIAECAEDLPLFNGNKYNNSEDDFNDTAEQEAETPKKKTRKKAKKAS